MPKHAKGSYFEKYIENLSAAQPRLSDLEGKVTKLIAAGGRGVISGMVRKAPRGEQARYVFAFLVPLISKNWKDTMMDPVYIPINPYMIDNINLEAPSLTLALPYKIKTYHHDAIEEFGSVAADLRKYGLG